MGKRFGGRQKGTPNKATADFKAALTRLLNASNLDELFEAVPPERRLETLGKLAEYVFPKQSRTEVTGKGGGPLEVVEIVRENPPTK